MAASTSSPDWRRWTANSLWWAAQICNAAAVGAAAIDQWQPWALLLRMVGMLATAGATAIAPPPTRDGRSGCADHHD